jgi:Zn-dependent M16 (insulinase) family peptidase
VTETFFTPAYTEPGSEKLELLTELLSRGQLHKLIREQGGAYGSGAKYSPFSGAFSFYSYRDPHTLETLENFSRSIDWVAAGDFA